MGLPPPLRGQERAVLLARGDLRRRLRDGHRPHRLHAGLAELPGRAPHVSQLEHAELPADAAGDQGALRQIPDPVCAGVGFIRLRKTVGTMVGTETMRRYPEEYEKYGARVTVGKEKSQ